MRSVCIQVEGGTLEAAWWGPGPAEAPTLVLLHEGLGSISLWRDVPERLAAATGWGVFAYSRFGYGNSATTLLPRPMTYMHHEAQVVLPQVLDAARIEHAVLVGHSDGGSIAAIYAGSVHAPGLEIAARAYFPAVVAPALRETPAHHTKQTEAQSASRCPDADDRLKQSVALLGIVTIAAHFFVEDVNISSIRKIKTDYDTGTLRQRLARHHRHVDTAFRGWNDAWLDPRFRDFDITGLLPRIQVPILALQGADDPYGTAEQLHVLEANVQAPITIQLIAGARHAPHLEAADETLTAITSFIATLPRGPST